MSKHIFKMQPNYRGEELEKRMRSLNRKMRAQNGFCETERLPKLEHDENKFPGSQFTHESMEEFIGRQVSEARSLKPLRRGR